MKESEFDSSPSWLNDEIIGKLKAEHGVIYLIQIPDLPDAAVVIKHPDRTAYKRFLAESSDERKHVKDKAFDIFSRSHVVFPVAEQFEEVLNLYPAILTTAGGELLRLAGIDDKVRAKKL